ncbi:MAG TPA: hypothetical protein VGR52_04035 [Stellaceae bacterium]|nr:hypothetical protein [Stellaceae bacterium]
MQSSSGTGFGTSLLLFALSAVGGTAVTLFLIISLSPLVALFPPTSGAPEIAYGIALMWGLVVTATIAVLSIGSYRRRRQTPDFYDAGWQERYVPKAPLHAAPAAPHAMARPAFDARLRQMDALMAANQALVERLERAAPRAQPAAQIAPLRPRAVQPQPRPVPMPAQRLRAYR